MNISAVNNSTSPLFNAVSSVKSAQAKKTGDEQDKEVKDSKVSSGGTILASATALRKDKTNFTDRNLTKVFQTQNAELLRNLSRLSDEDRAELATEAYLQMTGRIIKAKKNESEDIELFRSMQNEKAYYNGLLEDANEYSAKLSEEGGRYAFSGMKEGEAVSRNDLTEALADVQSRIDTMLNRGKDSAYGTSYENKKMSLDYAYYASIFENVTGLSGDCLKVDDESLDRYKSDRTEENFIQKAQENIDSLNKRQNDLHDFMERFREEIGADKFTGELSEEGTLMKNALEIVKALFVGAMTNTDPQALLDLKA